MVAILAKPIQGTGSATLMPGTGGQTIFNEISNISVGSTINLGKDIMESIDGIAGADKMKGWLDGGFGVTPPSLGINMQEGFINIGGRG